MKVFGFSNTIHFEMQFFMIFNSFIAIACRQTNAFGFIGKECFSFVSWSIGLVFTACTEEIHFNWIDGINEHLFAILQCSFLFVSINSTFAMQDFFSFMIILMHEHKQWRLSLSRGYHRLKINWCLSSEKLTLRNFAHVCSILRCS